LTSKPALYSIARIEAPSESVKRDTVPRQPQIDAKGAHQFEHLA
jgi:hypothetical protein